MTTHMTKELGESSLSFPTTITITSMSAWSSEHQIDYFLIWWAPSNASYASVKYTHPIKNLAKRQQKYTQLHSNT